MTAPLLLAISVAVAQQPQPSVPEAVGAEAPVPGATPLGAGVAGAPGVRFEVPFLPQGPLLCGGAAAAMLERYWGERGVYAEDYRALVLEDPGGIRTDDLARALRARGYVARVVQGPAALRRVERAEVEVPLVLLLSSGRTRFHYVVLVGIREREVLVHDPMLGPDRPVAIEELVRRWARSGYWALAVTPAGGSGSDAAAADVAAGQRSTAAVSASPESVTASRRLAAARPPAAAAAASPPPAIADVSASPPSTPARRSSTAAPSDTIRSPAWRDAETSGRRGLRPLARDAMAALREGRYADARMHARGLRGLRGSAPAWARLGERLLATASYLSGQHDRALVHWNRLGEPRLDLIEIHGLERTRHPLVWRHLGARPDEVLTRDALRRARRRLEQLPAVSSARVDYRPLADGSVVLEAAVVERGRAPSGYGILSAALHALVDDEAALTVGPLLGSGDAWILRGAWREADSRFGGRVALLMPPIPGVTHVAAAWRRQRFRAPGGGAVQEEHALVGAGAEHWWSGAWRGGASLGMHRWLGGPRFAVVGASALRRLWAGAAWVEADARAWMGVHHFGRFALTGAAEIPAGGSGRHSWLLRLHVALTSPGAPRSVWNGAGTGRFGEPLLRGHRLASGGATDGEAFGRGLAVASMQHVSWRAVGPGRVGVGVFLDTAWSAWRPAGAPSHLLLDPGAELLIELGDQRVAVSLAAGPGGPLLSARVDGVLRARY